jgi:hypothetical protein
MGGDSAHVAVEVDRCKTESPSPLAFPLLPQVHIGCLAPILLPQMQHSQELHLKEKNNNKTSIAGSTHEFKNNLEIVSLYVLPFMH